MGASLTHQPRNLEAAVSFLRRQRRQRASWSAAAFCHGQQRNSQKYTRNMCRLLFRFYDASGGSVRVGGSDVRDLTLASLRGAIAQVPQVLAQPFRVCKSPPACRQPADSCRSLRSAIAQVPQVRPPLPRLRNQT